MNLLKAKSGLFLLISVIIIPTFLFAAEPKSWVRGDFKLSGYLNTGFGGQHFSDATVTEMADDGSPGGPIGEWTDYANTLTAPPPNTDILQAFVQNLEIDISKHLGDRARLASEIRFGRALSGANMDGITSSHVYASVKLAEKHNIELTVGRFGLPTGFETFQNYFNETISYSIIWRSLMAAGAVTGAQVTANISKNVMLYFITGNGFARDWTFKGNDLPCFVGVLQINWGLEAYPSTILFTPFVGPESGDNKPLSYGNDVTMAWWLTKKFQLGFEGVYRRDNKKEGTTGQNTNYYAGLLNLHYEPNSKWYGVLKYCYSNQSAPGNGVISLTGAEQQIHEFSIGMAHYLAEGVKLRLEARGDMVDPNNSADQWIVGGVGGISWAF